MKTDPRRTADPSAPSANFAAGLGMTVGVGEANEMKNALVFDEHCLFCKIVRGSIAAHKVFEDDVSLGFLDHRPLFAGHTLFITKSHVDTLFDLPDALLQPVFANVRLLSQAVMQGMQAEGAFVAMNNRVSQSVPHFHVHIVPRRKGDGLKGFFWPRRAYKNEEEIEATLRALHAAIDALRGS